MAQDRPFKEIHVANFSVQKRRDRYPDPQNNYSYTNEANIMYYTGQGNEVPEEDEEPPRIALWRLNLVALSQNFNVYFAAYRDKIHCYVPRDLKQTLPSKADLILDLPQSDQAIKVGGYINEKRHHCVNHMIVGNLGDLEILLMATDDGDVIAFYTHVLVTELNNLDVTREAAISKSKAFFLQNVGNSAWGLAIHQKSRLIAVSCNPGNVTVFVHAMRDERSGNDPVDESPFEAYVEPSNEDFPSVNYHSNTRPEIFRRRRNFRVCLRLGVNGSNIPSIAFSSDSAGDAKSILAVDIIGSLWILGIWDDTVGDLEGMDHYPPTQGNRRAWGVLALPLENFKLTTTPHEAFGICDMSQSMTPCSHGQDCQSFDITSSVKDVRDNSSFHPACGYGINGPRSQRTGKSVLDHLVELALESNSDEDEQMASGSSSSSIINFGSNSSNDEDWESRKEKAIQVQQVQIFRCIARLPMSIRQSIGSWVDLEDRYQTLIALEEKGVTPVLHEEKETPKFLLSDHTAIFRCYSHDIELISPVVPPGFRTTLRSPLLQIIPRGLGHLEGLDRLILLASIPELSLVIVGSQMGRISLLTLTKLEEKSSRIGPLIMFRLDLVLPFKHHEDSNRPACPLLGMAVSPLQKSASSLGAEMLTRRRIWRLILHYYDHTILSYDLSRDSDRDSLTVASDGLRFRV